MSSPEDSLPTLAKPPESEDFIKKNKKQLLDALVQKKFDVFKDLLDSPKWGSVDASGGYSFLQLSILLSNKEFFDHMLSVPGFSLDYSNLQGQTALITALEGLIAEDTWTDEYYAYELVKKGADLDVCGFLGNTPLHSAVQRSYTKVVELLVEKAVDIDAVNRRGCVPLELVSLSNKDADEIVNMLLINGATPPIELFERSIKEGASFNVQENLFLYTFDQYADFDVNLPVLLALVGTKSPLFHEVMKYPIRVYIEENDIQIYSVFYHLCIFDIDYLKLIIEKFGDDLSQVFAQAASSAVQVLLYGVPISLENLTVMLESDFGLDLFDFITNLNKRNLHLHLIGLLRDELLTTQLYCLLLSYGFEVEEMDLQKVYEKFGFCDLFKILLHMDVHMDVRKNIIRHIRPILMYDMDADLSELLESHFKYTSTSINELLDYFVHPKLKELHQRLSERGVISKRENLQEVPLLTELARNVFRKYFIETCQIKTSRKFYTLVNQLPFSYILKNIITYETKLY